MPLRNIMIIAVTMIASFICYSAASKNKYANLFAEAMELIETEALKEVPREELFASAMDGMAKTLDKHSQFLAGEKYKLLTQEIQQEFGGLGIRIESNADTRQLFVLSALPGCPAHAAGFRTGDEIVKIDQTPMLELEFIDAIELMRGPVGQPLDIVLKRNGKLIPKRVNRASIPVSSVHGDFCNLDNDWDFTLQDHPRIGYIRLIQFGKNSAEEVKSAVEEIDGQVDSLILDLRNNSGGLLDAAVDICDYFLNEGELIVTTRSRTNERSTYSENAPLVDTDFPLVILIDRNSASASEVVAACLQDHGRAVIIGERSWGKGTVQNIVPMQRNESALKLTIASYWPPKNRSIDRFSDQAVKTKEWGVLPNENFVIEISELESVRTQRLRSLRDIEGLIDPADLHGLEFIRSLATQPIQTITDVNSSDNKPQLNELPDADSDADPDSPHQDRPLQKAIEFLNSLNHGLSIAA